MSHIFRFLGHRHNESTTKWFLDQNEIEHVRKALKLKLNDRIEVIDGRGHVATGVIESSSRDGITVNCPDVAFTSKSNLTVGIAIGALKPSDFENLLPDIVECDVDEIFVFQQDETAKFRTNDKSIERWNRIILSAVKQSKRAWIPELKVCQSLQEIIDSSAQYQNRYILDVGGQRTIMDEWATICDHVFAVVGGERGLNENELNLLSKHNFTTVRLGKTILRATTAAVAISAILSAKK
ncbi:MAG: RsmE family RNA methyltransferase [Proteobacteria bacterium]|nr:RsmE family RNA methyltransferase [Pseudomonadota bacterium]